MITCYAYKKCSSCKSAENYLKRHGIPFSSIDITEHPPSAGLLKRLVKNYGLGIKPFLNTSGEVYRTLGLKDKLKTMTEDDVIDLMAKYGRLIKRPLITNSEGLVTLGFKEETMLVWTRS
ncbi:MAG: Spx/MgsR family RNA polymerase-binding regulatory protein [Chitinophagaceae bacterium]|nr:Spx/MgsR family RNA polymerase-binding regulatory protein [Oligoflexus sp.]